MSFPGQCPGKIIGHACAEPELNFYGFAVDSHSSGIKSIKALRNQSIIGISGHSDGPSHNVVVFCTFCAARDESGFRNAASKLGMGMGIGMGHRHRHRNYFFYAWATSSL